MKKFRTWNGEMMSKPWTFLELIPDITGGYMDKDGVSCLWDGMEKQGAFVYESTGLLDCNGVEIFENDKVVIRQHYFGDSFIPEWTGQVLFDDGSFCVHNNTYQWMDLCDAEIQNNQIAVIGNIHEVKNESL